jgi:hypothetical protein
MADLPSPPPPRPAGADEALQYTHSGGRFLLGYGEGYFGIWERARSGAPVERFPRTLDGWQAAWRRYVTLEPMHTEVGLGTAPIPSPMAAMATVPSPSVGARPAVGQPTHPAWWLLPILMGWMGGLLAWLLLRDQDAGRARAMLVTGFVATVVWVVLYSMLVPVPASP